MTWLFNFSDLEAAIRFHDVQGFVGFSDLLTAEEFAALRAGVERAERAGALQTGQEQLESTNDAIFAATEIEAACRHPRIVQMAQRLVGSPIELQHAKFNSKPHSVGGGEVAWHQDYPFYPHTNFDLVSAVIHLDDETEELGAMHMVAGSHRWGVLSHVRDGRFAYRCTGRDDLDRLPTELLACRAGTVTFHHALTLHRSGNKSVDGPRRLLVFQYRAIDAVQLAGVVWKCAGYQVESRPQSPKTARFADGSVVELRGLGGRLIDMSGAFTPDR